MTETFNLAICLKQLVPL